MPKGVYRRKRRRTLKSKLKQGAFATLITARIVQLRQQITQLQRIKKAFKNG